MPNAVLDFIRSEDARFKDVPDDDLTLFIGSELPEFKQDPTFAKRYDLVRQKTRTAAVGTTDRALAAGLGGLSEYVVAPLADPLGTLVRGVQGFQKLIGSERPDAPPMPSPTAVAGQALTAAGDLAAQDVRNVLNIGMAATGQPPLGNVEPALPQQVAEEIGRAAPIIAGAILLRNAGIPAPLAFGGPMYASTYAQTGDPTKASMSGLIGAMMPGTSEAGAAGGELMAQRLAGRLKFGEKALRAAESIGRIAGSQSLLNGLMLAGQAPELGRLMEENPDAALDEITKTVALNLAFELPNLPPAARYTFARDRVDQYFKSPEYRNNVDEVAQAVLDPHNARVVADTFAVPGRPAPGTPGAALRTAVPVEVMQHPLGPGVGTRWQAIENTYFLAKLGQETFPKTPLEDVFLIQISDLNRQPFANYLAKRSELPEAQRELSELYPPGKFISSLQPGLTPYNPKKGEPSFKQWLAGEKPKPTAPEETHARPEPEAVVVAGGEPAGSPAQVAGGGPADVRPPAETKEGQAGAQPPAAAPPGVAAKPLELMAPIEFAAWHAGAGRGVQADQGTYLLLATREHKPINAQAWELYREQVLKTDPEALAGYVREGDQYVYKGLTTAAPAETVTSAGAGAETITGGPATAPTGSVTAPEQTGSSMPAEREKRPSPRRQPEDRPWDVIDEFEAQHAGKISLPLARKIIEDYRPRGAARKLFTSQGGTAPDLAAQSVSGMKDLGEEEFLLALNAAAEARKALRAERAREGRLVRVESKQVEQFQSKVISGKRPKKEMDNVETVPVGNMVAGDTFEVQGWKFKVRELEVDEDGNLQAVIVEDGPKFGVQRIEDTEVIHVDKNTYEPAEVEFLPPGVEAEAPAPPSAAPPTAGPPAAAAPPAKAEEPLFGAPESVEEQQARLEAEAAARQKKAEAEKVIEGAAKPLVGTRGDIGQTGLFGREDLFGDPAAAAARVSVAGDPRVAAALGDPAAAAALGAPAAPPIYPPPAATGYTMVMDARLPVTLKRTKPGSVSVPQIMTALETVQHVAGSQAGSIRVRRFFQQARGIFKPHEEVIRLNQADNVPTAVHEVGHALQQQLYGTAFASGLKGLPADVKRELIGLGKALYGGRKPAAGYVGEGFAEFTRYWLTTENAGKVAPHTTKYFETQVLPKYPKVAAEMHKARDLIDTYRHQGAEERARQQIVREPGAMRRALQSLAKMVTYQGQVEAGAPLEALSKAAEKSLRKQAAKVGAPVLPGQPLLPPSQDPFKIFSWKRGTAGAIVERMARENMVDVWGNPTGAPLADALAMVKGQRNEFLLYLFGRRALERWSKGKNPGITPEDAQFLKANYDSAEFRLAAQKYYDWWDGVLAYAVQADPSMLPIVAAIKQGSYDYAPLARMIDPAKAGRSAAQLSNNPFMRMHGSGLPVKDLFDQTFISAARIINRAHRAMVTNRIVQLAHVPGLGHLIEEVPRSRVREAVSIERIRKQLEDLGLDTTDVPEDTMLEWYNWADQPKGSDPIVSIRRGDSVRWFHVHPELYKTLTNLERFNLGSIKHIGPALDLLLGSPARAFRLGTTGLRPAFSLITNPTRDAQTLAMQSSVRNPARLPLEYAHALKGVLVEGLGGPADAYVKAFYDLAAHMGQPLGMDISHTRRVSNELFHGRFMSTVLNPVDHLRQLLSLPEAAPRVAELRGIAHDVGWKPGTKMTPDQAVQMALGAKRVTVDFSAAGDISRIVNEAVPFYNPSIQGMRSFARAFKEHPVRATLTGLAMLTAPTLLNWWMNKDKEWYRALPWRERYTFSHVDDGKHVWKIPRAFEWGAAFQVLPEAAWDSWYREDPRAAKEAFASVLQTLNPMDYPVLLKIAKEQAENRVAFWDRPIVPRSELDLPPSQQVGPYTTEVAKALGRAFPDLSPRRIDAAVRGYFGGVVPDLLDGIGLGVDRQQREYELSDLPVLGVLWRRGGEFNAQNQHINDFWDTYTRLQADTAGFVDNLKREAKGLPAGPRPNIDAADLARVGVAEEAAKAIRALVQAATRTKETQARGELYREAGRLAERINHDVLNPPKK